MLGAKREVYDLGSKMMDNMCVREGCSSQGKSLSGNKLDFWPKGEQGRAKFCTVL